MATTLSTDRPTRSEPGHVPAYGPIDAVLGYALFYVLLDRATPTIVETFTGILGFSPSAIRFGTAALLWFILAVTVIDQLRRQLAALGVLTHERIKPRSWAPAVFTEAQALGYVVLLVVGALLAYVTVETAIETAVGLIPIVATLDVGAFPIVDFVVMGVFFVSFAIATHALDRLVIGAIRAGLGE